MAKPSFYCENCGKEVLSGLEVCPGCGQTFSSVRCPSCGFTGGPELFRKSCPMCGYIGEEVKNSVLTKKNYLPSWIYRVLIGALLILIIYLIRIYFLL
ncbi:MAG: zinc ribbon domain-containing protein [Spirochaetales bacterium]|nr:zinc ribbon domain-containing protein [Spirochaetales bacterium]